MNFCYNCGQQLPLGNEKFCPNCGEKFESTRPSEKDKNGGSSMAIDGTNGDVIGIGTSGTGNFIGREIGYTVRGNVINLHVNNLSSGLIEDLRKIMSIQTQLPTSVATEDDYTKDVTNLIEIKETQQNITNIIDDVKKIEKKEGTQIHKIKAGDFQISRDDLFMKDALTRGTELFYKGQYNNALKWYEKTIELDANKADGWYNKGTILGKLGKYEEAIKSYDKAIEIKPDYAEAWYNKGTILRKLGKFKEAIKSYDKAIEIKPDYAEAWYNKGTILGESGKHKQAIKCYDIVKKIGMFIE